MQIEKLGKHNFASKSLKSRRSFPDKTCNALFSLLSLRDSVIGASNCRIGEYAKASDSLLTVLPTNSKLVAEVLVPAPAAGLVSKGQQAILRFDILPHDNSGSIRGVVSEITTTSVEGQPSANETQAPQGAFRAIISLDDQEIDLGGRKIKLQSGMLVSADIVLERRKAISWLLDSFHAN